MDSLEKLNETSSRSRVNNIPRKKNTTPFWILGIFLGFQLTFKLIGFFSHELQPFRDYDPCLRSLLLRKGEKSLSFNVFTIFQIIF